MPSAPSPTGPAGGGPSGWLGSQPVFEQRTNRKLGGAFGVSFAIHVGLFLLLALGVHHAVVVQQEENLKFNTVFLDQPGKGGGGGGSPAPAPPKKMEIPHPKPQAAPIPVPVPVEPPPPTLTAPIETNMAQVLQAQGSAMISQAPVGGGGRGTGIGSGTGSGLGPGSGGGTGGGVYEMGNGVESPVAIKSVQPTYTSEAMRAKIQGEVVLDAIVEPNGTLTILTVAKSLDRQFGLDQAAIDAATQWRFIPGKKDGQNVRVKVQMILEFRLH
jgi:protein TonB